MRYDRKSRFDHKDVVVINPVSVMLDHFENAVRDVLEMSDCKTSTLRVPEPSASGQSSTGWLLEYIRQLRRARGRQVIALWPVLGLLDIFLLRVLGVVNGSIVIHDPVPLVRAFGYGRSSCWLVRHFGSSDIELIVLSYSAAEDLKCYGLRNRITLLPHPMMEPRARLTRSGEDRALRVIGQYKDDRDLSLLSTVAMVYARDQLSLEVYGRGWPRLNGWSVADQFLSEDDFTKLIDTAAVVLVPYRRAYQSGVAIRCVERGVPVISSIPVLPLEKLAIREISRDESGAWDEGGLRLIIDEALRDDDLGAYSKARQMRKHVLEAWDYWIKLTAHRSGSA